MVLSAHPKLQTFALVFESNKSLLKLVISADFHMHFNNTADFENEVNSILNNRVKPSNAVTKRPPLRRMEEMLDEHVASQPAAALE